MDCESLRDELTQVATDDEAQESKPTKTAANSPRHVRVGDRR